MASTPFRVVVTARSATGKVTRGDLFEGDTLIATFSKSAGSAWCWPEVKVRFFSQNSRTRFESFCDSLSVSETLEALAT